MPLNIRDPRAQKLAKDLARRRGTTMTAVIIEALEKEMSTPLKPVSLERIEALQRKISASAQPGGRKMTKAERDALWGHE